MIFQQPVPSLQYPSHNRLIYQSQAVYDRKSFILLVKIDSLPGTEEAVMEEGEEFEKASELVGHVSIFIYLFFNL